VSNDGKKALRDEGGPKQTASDWSKKELAQEIQATR
jgi:ribosomal protein S6